jgi:5-hydroxyisourate hydrolase
MMARLSTHVLDTSAGRPARSVTVRLYGSARELRGTATTDGDGRALLAEDLAPGVYELVFGIGAYYGTGRDGFLDDVVVRFAIGSESKYHVPLLVSPYGYTTYRGS